MLVHVLLAVECTSECVFTKIAYKANEWSSIIRRIASICTNTLALSVQVRSIHYWFRMSTIHSYMYSHTYVYLLESLPAPLLAQLSPSSTSCSPCVTAPTG